MLYNAMNHDDDLVHSNRFILDPNIHAGYGMTAEIRKQKLRDHAQLTQALPEAPTNGEVLDDDFLKTNPVITDEGELKPLGTRAVLKEKRTVINVDSNQRSFFDTKDLELGDETTFSTYFSQEEYETFQELWRVIAKVQRELSTYREYALENEISIDVVGNSTDACRDLLRGITLGVTQPIQTNSAVNEDLLKLLLQIASANEFSGNLAIVNTLNAYAMAAAAVNPTFFWRPFFYDTVEEKAKIIIYKEQHPSSYRVTLPRIINHVKSIRLISTEIPNTINNINERNNLLTLSLRYKNTTTNPNIRNSVNKRPVELDISKCLFNFILIKLDIGLYTMEGLLKHIEDKLNDTVIVQTSRKFGAVFFVTWVKETGEIKIKCNRNELEFHIKFYSRLTELQKVYTSDNVFRGYTHGIISDYANDLWYMLGFPWPYEIDFDTTDKYTQLLTNKVSYGVHPEFATGHANNDIFDRERIQNSGTLSITDPYDPSKTLSYVNLSDQDRLLNDGRYLSVQTERPYRYPSIGYRYIYLVLKGYKSIDHMNQHNNVVVDFTDRDFFAKVQMNTDTGKIAYNTFVSNPLIFTNALDKIEYLDIQWVDDRGNIVDFGKVEHSFTLEFIHYVTQNDTNAYDTKLGVIDKKSYPDYLSGATSEVQYVKLGEEKSS